MWGEGGLSSGGPIAEAPKKKSLRESGVKVFFPQLRGWLCPGVTSIPPHGLFFISLALGYFWDTSIPVVAFFYPPPHDQIFFFRGWTWRVKKKTWNDWRRAGNKKSHVNIFFSSSSTLARNGEILYTSVNFLRKLKICRKFNIHR